MNILKDPKFKELLGKAIAEEAREMEAERLASLERQAKMRHEEEKRRERQAALQHEYEMAEKLRCQQIENEKKEARKQLKEAESKRLSEELDKLQQAKETEERFLERDNDK